MEGRSIAPNIFRTSLGPNTARVGIASPELLVITKTRPLTAIRSTVICISAIGVLTRIILVLSQRATILRSAYPGFQEIRMLHPLLVERHDELATFIHPIHRSIGPCHLVREVAGWIA